VLDLLASGSRLLRTQVDWQKGDAFHPEGFKHIFPHVDGVVHTLGILIEDGDYKQAMQNSNIPQLLSSLCRSITRDSGNPLKNGVPPESSEARLTYGAMNRDSGADVGVLYPMQVNPN